MINFSSEPYNDDFDENNKFHRILFRPSYAVQARELTQLQTILQNQIKRNGDHIFKQGAMVIPGQISLDTEYHYVKIQPTYGALSVESFIADFEGTVITGGTSGITALVLKVEHATGTDPTTLYVRYTNSGTNNATKIFANAEEITSDGSGTVNAFAASATGTGSAAEIERGVYYVNGYYVLCDAQTVLLDKYTNIPTYRVGLTIDEQKITPEDDETLLDNAQTSFNYAAPGAHRYFIDLILSKLSVTSTSDDNFIELLQVTEGIVNKQIVNTAYSELEKTLARRTYDESGNYTVSDFTIDVREHRNNNRGQWLASTPYLIGDVVTNAGHTYVAKISASSVSIAPIHTTGSAYDGGSSTGVNWLYNEAPAYNRGVYLTGNAAKLAIGLEPGKAYIQGYEVEKVAKEYVAIDKARDFVQVDNAVIPATIGNYVLVNNLNNLPKFDTFETVELYDRITNSGGRGTPVGTKIGTCRVRGAEWDTGTIGSVAAIYKLFVFDTTMVAGYDFNRDVKSFYYSGGSAPLSFTADISPVTTQLIGTYTPSLNRVIPTSAINTTTDTITYASHGLSASDAVIYTTGGGTAATGLTSGTTYYVATAGLTTGAFEVKAANTTGTLTATVAITGTSTATYTCGNSTLAVNDRVIITGTNTGGGVIGSYVSGTTYKVSAITGSSPNVTGFTLQTEAGVDISGNTAGTLIGLTYVTETVIDISGTGNNAQNFSKSTTTTITGQGTSFQTDLSAGDYIYLGSELRRVVTVSAQNTLVVDTAPTTTGQTIKLVKTAVYEPQNTGLIFPFPYYAIKSVRSSISTNDNSYTVSERFVGTSNGSASLSLTTSSGTFASTADNDNYLCVNNVTGDVVLPVSITPVGSSVTILFTSPTYNSTSFTVSTAVNKTGASLTEKTKTTASATVTFTTLAAATNKILMLSKADLIKITSIKMKSGDFVTPGATYSIDISDRFTVDSGHRDSHYDVARLNLIPSFNAPEAPVEVIFDYFVHGAGDYFTVNSYPADVRYEDITPQLRDGIDFRPRIADAGVLFSGTGSSLTLMPKRGIDVRSDFTYYLARRDKIVLNFAGVFSDVVGISALNPGLPEDPSLSMVLYNLSIEPYTFSTEVGSVQVNKIDNKRYTMRDIGKLEKRIDNLEYYTSLSLLEQQTESMAITDTAGLSRFKNGFIVDAFTGHGVGETTSLDYLCSVDAENAELRPFFTMDNVNLIEKNTDDAGRATSNYKLYGDVITLPVIDHVKLVEQRYASRLENINPFAVFTFLGDVKLNPSSDEWFEVDRRPDIIQEVEGNFNMMYAIAEKAGVIGTIWNAWENVWVGATIDTSRQTQIWRRHHHHGMARDLVTATTATNIGQSRTGIKTSVVAKIDTKVLQDKVLSTAIIPYIRSRNVLVQIRGLKPATIFYPFFDGVDIASYCTPSTKLTYTITSGTFNTEQNVGGDSAELSRMIDGDSQVCLNKGDVLFVSSRSSVPYTKSTSPATAIVIGKDYNIDTGVRTLHLANIKGAFLLNDTIEGSVSAAVGSVSITPTVATIGQSLLTNFAGEISLLFNIPNTESHRFRTGNKEFKLIDVSTVDGAFTSRGRTQYNAVGILETKQKTVEATRNSELVSERVDATQTIIQTGSRVVSDTGWYDPLAQTFLIDSAGGAFISKIDIFFASKDTKIPVTMELREVVNGYPGKRVLPFSRVSLNPEDVNLSTNIVSIVDKATGLTEEVPKYDTLTSFTFPSPVFVQDKEEYCVVLLSDSSNYKVWISNMGDAIPDSSQTISEQPYNGVLFKSQNASTWTANQDQDLKFTIWRAKFDTGVVGNVEFVNDVLPYDSLDIDPIEVKSGTNTVRVWHMDHAMSSGSTVELANLTTANIAGVAGAGTISVTATNPLVTGSGTEFETVIGTGTTGAGTVLYNSGGVKIGVVASVGSQTAITLVAGSAVTVPSLIVPITTGAYYIAAPIAGIPVTEIYTSHVIGNVDLDSYTITTTTNANTTGYFGGTTVRATKNVQYDAFHPIVQSQLFTETAANYSIKMTSGKSVDGSQTPYTLGAFEGCLANETNTLYAPSMVASGINETLSVGGNKSLAFSAQISSANDALSPIIDTHRLSLIAISNKVNSPSEANMNVAALDLATLFTGATGAFSFSGSTITSTNATVRNLIKTIQVGKYITVSASTTAGNDGTYLVTGNVDGSDTGAGLVTTTLISPTVTGNGSTVFLSSIGSGTTGAGTILYNSTGIVIGVVASVASNNVLTLVGNAAVALTTGAYKITSTTATISNKTFTGEAGAAGTTVAVRKMFVDEIAPVGSSTHSKYVSKVINLENPSTYVRVRLAANVPDEADLLVYYKTIEVGSSHTPETINWTLFNADTGIVKVQNGNETFSDVDYSIVGRAPFDAIQVKLVMKTTNSSAVSRVKDLRIICCA